MIISLESFRGMKPRVAEHLLEANMSSLAQNCNLLKGSLRPWKNKSLDTTLAQTSLIKTINLYLSAYWLEFSATVNVQSGPIAGDTKSKIYYTGDGVPKKTDSVEATTGSPPYPINFYPMGAPTPAHAIVAALGSGGTGDPRTIGYVWTIVTSWGEEGPPADASNLVSAIQGQTVNLSGITIDWTNGYPYERGMWCRPTTPNGYVYRCSSTGNQASGPTEPTWETTIDGDTVDGSITWTCYKTDILTGSGALKRVYRINTGDTFGQWTFIGSVAFGTSVFVDNDEDTDIAGNAILPSSSWLEPPSGMAGLTSIGRFFAGFVGKDIFFSEPNYPHAWPDEYSFPVDFPVVGLGSIGNTLIVGTEQNAFIIHGTHPSVMTPIKLPEAHACVSARGIVSFPGGVAFPTNDGLYFITTATGRTITKDAYSTEDWKKLHPQTWHATRHDGRYFAFYDNGAGDKGGVIIDLSGEITTLDFYATAVYVDPKTDTLYYNLGE